MIPRRKRRPPAWPLELRRLLLINIATVVGAVGAVAAVAGAAQAIGMGYAPVLAVAGGVAAAAVAATAAAAAASSRRQHAEVRRRFAHLLDSLPPRFDSLPPIERLVQSFDAYYSAAREDKAQLTAVISSMSDGVIATDYQQRVLLTNAAAREHLAVTSETPCGQMLWDILTHERVTDAVTEVSLTGQRTTIELGPVRERHLEVTVCRLPLRPAGFVIVTHDVTEAMRYEELRKEFVANVSHELRTPLTMIKGFVETLLGGAIDDPPRARQYLATVQKHSDQLERLVVDLLDLSRLDSSGAAPTMQPVRLDDVAARVVEELAPSTERKGQVLALSKAAALVMGDEAQLERAMINLVDNAIKYSGTGGRIEVAVAEDGAYATVRVTDDGPGIALSDQPRIFERFYRVDRSRAREMGGTGLGLSIVKHIAQAHGGSVELSSALGCGSTFTLRLPRGRVPRD